MKKYFTRFMALVCCLAASLTASAQFSATIEMYPMSSYATKATSFSLTEVATTLGTEPAVLVETLDAWVNAEGEVETNYIFLGSKDAEGATNYTQGGRGQFWMDKDPKAVTWGQGSCWYNMNSWDVEADTYTIEIGQFPDTLVAGEELKAHFILALNEKEATFDITLKVVEKPAVEIPTPVTTISQLNIVGSQTVEVEQYPRTSYASDAVEVDLTGIAEKLGTTDEVIADYLADLLYTTTFVTENELPIKTDSLSNEASATAPGWWFAQIYDTTEEIIADEVARSGYGSGCSFFIESYSYDAETATLSGNLGQYPGNLNAEDVRIANVYIIWGDKAYQITYKLTIVAKEEQGLDDYTKVGEAELSLEFEVADSYDGGEITLDVEAIMAALGVEAWKDITVMVKDANGGVTVGGTANNGGSWLTAEGTLTSWGSNSALFFEPNSSSDWSVLNVGQYPNTLDYDTEYSFPIYFIAGENYYEVTVKVKTLPEQDPGPDPGEKVAQSEYHSVGEIAVKIQAVPNNQGVYEIPMHFTYNGEYVAELVGTDKPTLFTDVEPSEDPEADKYSNGYTCTPYPGFWMSRDGYVTSWSSANSPWGATFDIADAEITFYQYPSFSDNIPGKTYNANMYLVNEYTGAMVTFKINLRFVSDIVAVEEVGSEDILLTKGSATLDITAAIDSLGLKELEEPLDADGLLGVPSLVLLNEDGTYTEPIDATSGAYLTDKGYIDFSENNADGALYFYLDFNDATSVKAVVEEQNSFQLTPETAISTKFGLQYGEKLYVFNTKFVDPETYVGVSSVKAQTAPAATFDLTGRRVKSAAQRGIYIQAGKKVLR